MEPACSTSFPHGVQTPQTNTTYPFSHQARVSRQPRCSRQSLWALKRAEAAVKHSTLFFKLGRQYLMRQPDAIMSPSWEVFCNAKLTAELGIQLAPCPGHQICWQIQVVALGERLPSFWGWEATWLVVWLYPLHDMVSQRWGKRQPWP